jgi:hypothetical protein
MQSPSPPVSSSLLGSNNSLSTLFSNTLGLFLHYLFRAFWCNDAPLIHLQSYIAATCFGNTTSSGSSTPWLKFINITLHSLHVVQGQGPYGIEDKLNICIWIKTTAQRHTNFKQRITNTQ